MSKDTATDPDTLPWLGRKLLWLDKKENVDRIVSGLYAVCAVLFAADFFYAKYITFRVENIPGFYALYGFFLSAALVLGARAMRVVVKREEDYYAPCDVESEAYPEDQLERIDHNG